MRPFTRAKYRSLATRSAASQRRRGPESTGLTVGRLQAIRHQVPAEVQLHLPQPSSQVDIAPGLQPLGYDLPMRQASPGETVKVALYWRASDDVSRDYVLSLLLSDANRKPQVVQESRPVNNTYPTTEWEKGEVLRDWHDLRLPPGTPAGDYQLSLQVLKGGETIGQASLGRIEGRGRAHQFDVPEIQHPLKATSGDGVLILGYDLSSGEVRPGGTLRLTLHWQAPEDMQPSYTVFTHVLDSEGLLCGQMDSIPLTGEAPTTSRVPGEVLVDEYDIVVQPEAPPGGCRIEIGMYDASTGQRLPIHDSQGRLLGDRVLLHPTRMLGSE